jgi:hypothetical protein
MKKIIGLLSLVVLVTITACSDSKPVEVKKEVIVVPSVPANIVKEVPEKKTTIILDNNGVKVATKKIDVTINPDKKKQ